MKEKNVYFYLGIILALLSLILLLMHVRVGTFHFYRFGRISSGPICIILMIISFIALMVRPCKATTIFLIFSIIALVLDIIVSLHVYLVGMSFFTFILILIPGCIGVALIIKSLIAK